MSRQLSTRSAAIAVSSAALGLTMIASGSLATASPSGASSSTQTTVQRSDRSGHTLAPVSLPDGFRPEGITSGPGDTYYTGSLADGRIWTGDLSRGTGRQLLAGVTGRALRGMQWDPRTGLLWVTGNDKDAVGIVLAVDVRTGQVKKRIVVPGAVFLNDVVLARNALWVTDSGVDKLTKIPLDHHGRISGALSQVTLSAPWPTPEGNRANGIRELRDGSLIIDNSTAGGLWQVSPKTGTVRQILVFGVPASSAGIVGGDGLELRGDTLYVVRGGSDEEVDVLQLKHRGHTWAAWWKDTLTSPALDVPSTATLAGHTLWAVNARFGVTSPDTATYQIIPLPTGKK